MKTEKNLIRKRHARRTRRVIRSTGMALAFCGLFATGVQSKTDNAIRVELNKLQSVDDACRAYMVFANGTEHEISALKLDLVVFDPDGIISRRLAVSAPELRAGKTRVQLFDMPKLSCADVARVLLNRVMSCTTKALESRNCGALVRPTSRASAEFMK